ncbi:ATP-binding protein [Aeribacillus composti]|nr:ATP-binding protein [Aeribacillus composti]
MWIFRLKNAHCTCSAKQIQAYRNHVSGPIYDRMDVLLPLEVIDFSTETRVSESSETIRKKVEEVRRKQNERCFSSRLSNS